MSSKKDLVDEDLSGPRYKDLKDREPDQKKYVAEFQY
jgi:hypothetical protein